MSQQLTIFHIFGNLPNELQDKIWVDSAEYPRFLEIAILNNRSELVNSNTLDDEGLVYFKNPFGFDAQLPGGLMVTKKSRNAILPLYSVLDLGTWRVNRKCQTEYTWMDVAPPQYSELLDKTRVMFNPDWDTVVLQVGHVLFKHGVLQWKIPRQLQRMAITRDKQKSYVQHLITTFFPWDENERLPRNPGDMVEAFPGLSTLSVIGHRNSDCCGYCPPPRPKLNVQEKVKNKVIKVLERTMKHKRRDPKSIPDVRTYSLNHRFLANYDPQRPWYAFIAPRTVFRDAQGFYLPSIADPDWRSEGLKEPDHGSRSEDSETGLEMDSEEAVVV
ncbi:hypothetical protein ONS95_009987 [Cadophora gregata]|uniref:uncharacterized protein n=1 Tax=Cadophora gregata TaxID=51156 RepID=UPI0026DD30B1|nr:uncharacterized protein ONS95_009987 [Cadophora gregata]KAK0121702.1 hypothetical protein ONS95_009987 [Cadophora gregata]KAK0127179.1 hypothetical protein ONS96_006731 [Cadophora gregata f. sp. sojae]